MGTTTERILQALAGGSRYGWELVHTLNITVDDLDNAVAEGLISYDERIGYRLRELGGHPMSQRMTEQEMLECVEHVMILRKAPHESCNKQFDAKVNEVRAKDVQALAQLIESYQRMRETLEGIVSLIEGDGSVQDMVEGIETEARRALPTKEGQQNG